MDGYTVEDVLARLRAGDREMHSRVFQRYFEPLARQAVCGLGLTYQPRIGADDVVQSVFRSLWQRPENIPETFHSVFGLLLYRTRCKLRRKRQHANRQKRDVRRDAHPDPVEAEAVFGFTEDVDPDEASDVQDALRRMLERLSDERRKIVEMVLAGRTQEEIADELGWAVRTVGRAVAQARDVLRELLPADPDPPPTGATP